MPGIPFELCYSSGRLESAACGQILRSKPATLPTLAVRQQSQTIRFKSEAQTLDTFGMANGGKEYRRLVGTFERVFGAIVFFGSDSAHGQTRVVRR